MPRTKLLNYVDKIALLKRETGRKVDKEGRIVRDVVSKYFNVNDEPALEVGRVVMGTNPPSLSKNRHPNQRPNPKKTWCLGLYAGDDYNLTLCPNCPLQSLFQHMYHGQPYTRVDLNPMPESALSPSQGLRIWPLLIRRPDV